MMSKSAIARVLNRDRRLRSHYAAGVTRVWRIECDGGGVDTVASIIITIIIIIMIISRPNFTDCSPEIRSSTHSRPFRKNQNKIIDGRLNTYVLHQTLYTTNAATILQLCHRSVSLTHVCGTHAHTVSTTYRHVQDYCVYLCSTRFKPNGMSIIFWGYNKIDIYKSADWSSPSHYNKLCSRFLFFIPKVTHALSIGLSSSDLY